MQATNVVTISGVHKRFGMGKGLVSALFDVNLSIGEHEFICLLGPSGCGKTTLLNLLAGFEQPTNGTIQAFGRPIAGPAPERTMVFQDYALFPWMTVSDNIQYGLRRRGTAYVLAIGVNRYADAEYNLKYAVPDADLFATDIERRHNSFPGIDYRLYA